MLEPEQIRMWAVEQAIMAAQTAIIDREDIPRMARVLSVFAGTGSFEKPSADLKEAMNG